MFSSTPPAPPTTGLFSGAGLAPAKPTGTLDDLIYFGQVIFGGYPLG